MTTPARITTIETYWTNPPPKRSARCEWWIKRIESGWLRNRRMRMWGYYESAKYFGVYIWEWLNVLGPMLTQRERHGPPPEPGRNEL